MISAATKTVVSAEDMQFVFVKKASKLFILDFMNKCNITPLKSIFLLYRLNTADTENNFRSLPFLSPGITIVKVVRGLWWKF